MASSPRFRPPVLAVLVLLVVVGSPSLLAQLQGGGLYGTVTDPDGHPLSGVSVTLHGVTGPICKSTDEKGQIRFLRLDPGTYRIVAELDGYSRVVYEKVSIRVGRNTTLQLQMSQVLEETITVTTEPPLIDPTDMTQEITVTEFELDEIPSNRDPWAIVSQAPGVVVDRVNVGGSESGQQAVFVGPGSSSRENAYIVDGVNITDMAAVGASPTYYDFEQLGEMQVSSGGAEASRTSAGVTLNLTTKRGTNQWRGTARLFHTAESWQSSANVDRRDFAPGQTQSTTNRVRGIDEYGLEAGGPLLRERFWIWGAYARNDIDRIALGGHPDDIDLENLALKLNLEATDSTSALLSVNSGDKARYGRGAGLNRSRASQWDQLGGADLFKAEVSHLFKANFYTSLLFSVLDSDWNLDPKGGVSSEIYRDAEGVWQGGYVSLDDSRDTRQLRFDGSYFADSARLSHEIEFEVGSRNFRVDIAEQWGPRNLVHFAAENTGGLATFEALRPGPLAVSQDYHSAWVQDTVSAGRTTLRFGLRYDLQEAENLPGDVAQHPVFPELLPALDLPRQSAGFTWAMLSPRLGVTHALDETGGTLLRATYSRYPSQIYSSLAARVALPYDSGALFEFDDRDGDGIFDQGEEHRLLSTFGVDAKNPGSMSPNVNDAGLEPETTDELTLGIEHSPSPRIVLGADVIYRSVSDILEGRRLVAMGEEVREAEREDFVLEDVVTGSLPNDRGRFEVPVYALRNDLDFTGGTVLRNGDRRQEYLGLSLTATKRMANRWMLRGHITLSDWNWQIGPDFLRHDDPTDLALAFGPDSLVSNVDTPGEVVAEPSRDGSDSVFLNSGWQFNVAALYQVAPTRPWGFNVAANVNGRQGFPSPYRVTVIPSDGLLREVQVTGRGDDVRFDDVVLADLRVEKEVRLGGLGAIVSLDVFNLLNDGAVLERSLQLNGPQADFLQRTMSPRVFRLGLRLQWDR